MKNNEIAKFVAKNLPSSSDVISLSVKDLRKLFYANHDIEYDYKSNCNDENKRVDYLKELINRNEAFNHGILANAIIVLSTSQGNPLMLEEMRIIEPIAEKIKGEIEFMVKTDNNLEKELRMNIAFYE